MSIWRPRSFSIIYLPVLKLDSQNKTASWKAWLQNLESSIKLISLRFGKRLGFFRDRIKVLALLYSIGKDEQDVLDSVSCDTMDANVI